jgi:hypothetical protein
MAKSAIGTNMPQEDYLKLEKVGDELSDAEAKVLINDEFAFEVSRIKILHKAELDATPEGARHISLEEVPRKPVYAATDWNYIRFDVRGCAATWQFEMINAQLYEVYT